jgi:hypothetical protein
MEEVVMLKTFLLSNMVFRWLYGILGFVVGVVITIFFLSEHVLLMDILKISLAPLAIFTSVLLASRQFVYVREWNKKDAASKALKEFVDKYNTIVEALQPHINLRQRIRNQEKLSIEEIHNLMGVFCIDERDNNKYNFIYHGAQTQDDIKCIHKIDTSKYIQDFLDNVDGRKIERFLISLLVDMNILLQL